MTIFVSVNKQIVDYISNNDLSLFCRLPSVPLPSLSAGSEPMQFITCAITYLRMGTSLKIIMFCSRNPWNNTRFCASSRIAIWMQFFFFHFLSSVYSPSHSAHKCDMLVANGISVDVFPSHSTITFQLVGIVLLGWTCKIPTILNTCVFVAPFWLIVIYF